MRLANTKYNLDIELIENKVTVISVENPLAYRDIIGSIWNQAEGVEGDFILSDEERIVNISKEVESVFNIFDMDFNSKKIVTKLYQELKEQSQILLQEETVEMNSYLLSYVDKLVMTVPYNIKYKLDMDIGSLLKMFSVEISNDSECLLEKIIEYIKVMNQICHIKTFVFVGLKYYLKEYELHFLYEFVFYQKIHLLIIEPFHTPKLDEEKCCIIDSDLCIIDI